MDKFKEKLNDMLLCIENVKKLYDSEIKDYGKIAELLKNASLNMMALAVINLDNLLGVNTENEKV